MRSTKTPVRGMPMMVSVKPKRYFKLNECGDQVICPASGFFRDYSGQTGNNATETNIVLGRADYIANP